MTEITKITKVKRPTLDSYLKRLKSKGIVEFLPHEANREWGGGVFRLTKNGRERLKKEMQNFFLAILNVINPSNQSLEKTNLISNLDELIRTVVKLL